MPAPVTYDKPTSQSRHRHNDLKWKIRRGLQTPPRSLRRRSRLPAFEPAHPGCPRICPSWTSGIGSDGSPHTACEPQGEFARDPYSYCQRSPVPHPVLGCARSGLSMPSSGPTSAGTCPVQNTSRRSRSPLLWPLHPFCLAFVRARHEFRSDPIGVNIPGKCSVIGVRLPDRSLVNGYCSLGKELVPSKKSTCPGKKSTCLGYYSAWEITTPFSDPTEPIRRSPSDGALARDLITIKSLSKNVDKHDSDIWKTEQSDVQSDVQSQCDSLPRCLQDAEVRDGDQQNELNVCKHNVCKKH
eukprot:1175480-Prorocentrum_minimum.AAC.2